MTDTDRIRLTFPEPTLFTCELTIGVGELNYGNHLANDAVLRLAHEARIRWLKSHNMSEINAFGCGLIMADAAIQYRNQAFHGDVLQLQLAIGHIGSAGFSLYYRIHRPQDQRDIAIIKTGMVFFDYTNQSIAATPAAFLAQFTTAQT